MTQPSSLLFRGRSFVFGQAHGPSLTSDTELSFWGGVDPALGEVIDRHHPLSGQALQGKILILPGGRGSCSGSGVLLEMLVNGTGPNAIIVSRPDDIITLGVLVAQEMFGQSIPVVMLEEDDFKSIQGCSYVSISGDQVIGANAQLGQDADFPNEREPSLDGLQLSSMDQALLAGEQGQAAQVAMKIILQMAQLMGAKELMDIEQVHIDGCVYTGKASLAFAQKLRDMGGRVAVPTSLNSISVDYQRWRDQGVDPDFGEQASALADAYMDMGARGTFTCAPYLLETAPGQGQQIAWAESNAVVFANSVLGARTMKYPDFLDACIALTGRAPLAGPHISANRKAAALVTMRDIGESVDDALYPLLGYKIGQLAGNRIVAVDGLAHLAPDHDDLKAFGAAFATVSSAPMFHIIGVTPDALERDWALSEVAPIERYDLTPKDLFDTWQGLNGAAGENIDFISLGNPHFSLSEFAKLSELCAGKTKANPVEMVITSSRDVVQKARDASYLAPIETFGAKIVTDTCWCMIGEPVITPTSRTILTNSAKYAHYGPGITGRTFRIGSLADCVLAASRGSLPAKRPHWM